MYKHLIQFQLKNIYFNENKQYSNQSTYTKLFYQLILKTPQNTNNTLENNVTYIIYL